MVNFVGRLGEAMMTSCLFKHPPDAAVDALRRCDEPLNQPALSKAGDSRNVLGLIQSALSAKTVIS